MAVDPMAIVTALGVSQLAVKVLGPTAEYLGEGLKDRLARKRRENLDRIFENAAKKLGDKLEEEGAVPPRVLKEVIDEGTYFDDELSADYFGGVLASSRSSITRDDRGAVWARFLTNLSIYEIRTHYIIYKSIHSKLQGQTINFSSSKESQDVAFYIPFAAYFTAMEFSEEETSKRHGIIAETLDGLRANRLIDHYQYGPTEIITEGLRFASGSIQEPGIILLPTQTGAALFLWAHGHGDVATNFFLETELQADVDVNLPMGEIQIIRSSSVK